MQFLSLLKTKTFGCKEASFKAVQDAYNLCSAREHPWFVSTVMSRWRYWFNILQDRFHFSYAIFSHVWWYSLFNKEKKTQIAFTASFSPYCCVERIFSVQKKRCQNLLCARYSPWLIPTHSKSLLNKLIFDYSRSHIFMFPAVAGCHCFWLYPGQQWSQVSPQVLCWHSQWNLQNESHFTEVGFYFFLIFLQSKIYTYCEKLMFCPFVYRIQIVILEHSRTCL